MALNCSDVNLDWSTVQLCSEVASPSVWSSSAYLPQLVPPSACYTEEKAAVLGFKILRKDLQKHAVKFGVGRDSPISECVSRLIAKRPSPYSNISRDAPYYAHRPA